MVGNYYMIRHKFFVPKSEVARDYRYRGDKKAYNFIYSFEWEDVDGRQDESSEELGDDD